MTDLESEGAKRPDIQKFPFKFTNLMLGLCILGIVLSAAGIALTSWQFIGFLGGDISSVYEWMKYILLYLVSILLGVLLVAMLFRSQYVLTQDKLIMQFGLIKQKYDIAKIRSVHLFHGAKKLAVYFDDFKSDYIMILIKEAWHSEFIAALTARNERIAVSFSTPEEEEEVKKKKK